MLVLKNSIIENDALKNISSGMKSVFDINDVILRIDGSKNPSHSILMHDDNDDIYPSTATSILYLFSK